MWLVAIILIGEHRYGRFPLSQKVLEMVPIYVFNFPASLSDFPPTFS